MLGLCLKCFTSSHFKTFFFHTLFFVQLYVQNAWTQRHLIQAEMQALNLRVILRYPVEKDLGILVNRCLNITQCVPRWPRRSNGIWAWISNTVATRMRAVIFPLYSALVRPHLKSGVQFSTRKALRCRNESREEQWSWGRVQRVNLCEERLRTGGV